MDKQFDELSKSLAEGVSCREALRKFSMGLTLLAVLAVGFAVPAEGEDLYVNASAPSNGSGTASSPYWRITDAVVRARSDRQNSVIPLSETITIHVASGTYTGSFSASGPQLEALPIVINVPNLVLQGATTLTLDSSGLPTGPADKAAQSIIRSKDELKDLATGLVIITHTTDGGAGDAVTMAGFTLNAAGGYHGIVADHVSQFTLAGNLVSGGYLNVYSRATSGTIAGNLLSNSSTVGCLCEGGTGLFPSNVTVTASRLDDDGESGIAANDYSSDLTLDLGQSGLTALPFQYGGNNPDLPNGLTL